MSAPFPVRRAELSGCCRRRRLKVLEDESRQLQNRFSEEQIIGVLREQEEGARIEEVCRRRGVSTTTFYKWKARYGSLEVSGTRRLKAAEDENRRLKKLLAEAVLDVAALKDLLAKN